MVTSVHYLQTFLVFLLCGGYKEIVCNEKLFINEAEYYSNKYQIPINSAPSENCYIDLNFENYLVFNEERISNCFHKDPFLKRVKNFQREIMIKSNSSKLISSKDFDATVGFKMVLFLLCWVKK